MLPALGGVLTYAAAFYALQPQTGVALGDFPGAQFLELPVFCFSVKARFAMSEAQWKLNMDAC